MKRPNWRRWAVEPLEDRRLLAVTFTGIGQMAANWSSLLGGLSGDGKVVVGYTASGVQSTSFRWTAEDGMVAIHPDSSAYAASFDGSVIVGNLQGPNSFRWTDAGGFQETSVPQNPTGLSEDGSVVVGFNTPSGGSYFAYRNDSEIAGGQANGVSADGSIVVGWDGAGYAFRWTAVAGSERIGKGVADAISADGSVIVGRQVTGRVPTGDLTQAFRWTAAGGMQTIGGDFSEAFGVSGDGSVVVGGMASQPTTGNDQAFVYDSTNGLRNLTDVLTAAGIDLTGWKLKEARAVSWDGRIVAGNGINPDGLGEVWVVDLGVNEAPTDILLSPASVAEHSAAHVVVGDLSTVDPEKTDTHSYELLNSAGGRFVLDGSHIAVASGALLDYESATSQTIRVKTTDSGGLSFEKDLVIQVTNVNEAPTDLKLSPLTVPENSPNGFVIGTLLASDPDAGDTITYSLTNTASARFRLEDNHLVVDNGGLLNFETAQDHKIRVKATDSGGLSVEKDFDITVTDVNEAPTDIAVSNLSVPENSAPAFVVGDLSGIDPDANDQLTFSVVGQQEPFRVQGTQLLVSDGAVLDFETATSHVIRLKATDLGGLSIEKDFTIQVEDVPEVVASVVRPDGHRYDVIAATKTWTDAKAAAEVNEYLQYASSHLVSIDDAAENEFLRQSLALPSDKAAWIGFTDQAEEGTWRWVDDTPGEWQDGRLHSQPQQTAYVNWADEQPDLTFVTLAAPSRAVYAGDQTVSSTDLGVFDASVSYSPDFPEDGYDSSASQWSKFDASSAEFIVGGGSVFCQRYGGSTSTLTATFDVVQPTLAAFSGTLTNGKWGERTSGGTASLRGATIALDPASSASPEFSDIKFDYDIILPAGSYTLSADSSCGGWSLYSGQAQWSATLTLEHKQAATFLAESGKWASKSIYDTAPYYIVEYEPNNVAPADIILDQNTIAENAGPGVVVGQLSAVDDGGAHDFALVNDAGGKFLLAGDKLTLASATLDYETKQSYVVRVRATDSGGLSFEKDLTIQVTNVNEAPIITVPPVNLSSPGGVLPLSGLFVSDPDLLGADLDTKPLRLALTADHGTVLLGSVVRLAIVSGANGSPSVTVEGSVNALNAALGTLSHKAAQDFSGVAHVSLDLNDLGHSGEGSPLSTSVALGIHVDTPPVAQPDHYEIDFGRTLNAQSYSQAVLDSGPLAYWRLGDSGPIVEDSAGDYEGTTSAATVLGLSGALAGDSNKAASLPDVNSRILVAGAEALAQPTGAFSVEAWVNPSESLAWQRIASTRNGPNGGWGFALSNQRLAFTTYGIQDYFLEGHPVPTNQWSHVAVVFDSNFDASFFLNGTFVGKVDGSAQPNPGGSLFAIGDNPDQSAQPFLGKLDEVAFYGKLLTASEVSRHYQAGLLNATVLVNDTDADGDALHALLVAQPQHGQLTFAADGSFTYKPNAGFYGQDKFTYRAVDAYFQSAETEVLIDVIPVPGDADLDGDVDLADFGILKQFFGTGTTRQQGDFNGDGKVDLADFGIMKEKFGTVEPEND